jgi:putative endonuclease
VAEHNILGQRGEQLAVDYLIKKGYQILETNWRKHKFELDIIAQDKNELVIIEVKTRSTSFFGNPEEAITISKQKQIQDGASCYIEVKEIDLDCRFDVIAIVINSGVQEINHIIDAFYPEVE